MARIRLAFTIYLAMVMTCWSGAALAFVPPPPPSYATPGLPPEAPKYCEVKDPNQGQSGQPIPGQFNVSLVGPTIHVPRWGMFCGPDYSYGHGSWENDYQAIVSSCEASDRRQRLGQGEQRIIPVNTSTQSFNTYCWGPRDNLDDLCRSHDWAYSKAGNEPAAIMAADTTLLNDVSKALDTGKISIMAIPYARKLLAAFYLKRGLWDAPKVRISQAGEALAALSRFIH